MASKKENTKLDVINDTRIITLKCVYDKSGQVLRTVPVPDKYGHLPTCVKKVNAQGDMIMSEKERNDFAEGKAAFYPETHMFEIKSSEPSTCTFDLNDIWQAAAWEAIKNSPYIAMSRDLRDSSGNLVIDGPVSTPKKPTRNGIACWYVENPVQETASKVSKKKLRHTALDFIFNDPRGADGLLTMAKLLGKDMRNQPIVDVEDYLIRIAEETPQKIIDLYTGDTIHTRLLFVDARDKHVIYYKNKLFMYGDSIVLGATDDAAIAWLRNPKNKRVVDLIQKDTYPEYYPEDEESSKKKD